MARLSGNRSGGGYGGSSAVSQAQSLASKNYIRRICSMLSRQRSFVRSTASCGKRLRRYRQCIKYFQEKAYHMMDWLFFFILSKSGDNKYKSTPGTKGETIFPALADMRLGYLWLSDFVKRFSLEMQKKHWYSCPICATINQSISFLFSERHDRF